MSVIKTKTYRRILAQDMYDRLYGSCFLAIGTGGHYADHTPKAPDPGQTALIHEVMRLVGKVERQSDYTVKVHALFPLKDLDDYSEISEIGLFVSDDLLAVRNAAPTIVDPNNTFDGYNAAIIFPY